MSFVDLIEYRNIYINYVVLPPSNLSRWQRGWYFVDKEYKPGSQLGSLVNPVIHSAIYMMIVLKIPKSTLALPSIDLDLKWNDLHFVIVLVSLYVANALRIFLGNEINLICSCGVSLVQMANS